MVFFHLWILTSVDIFRQSVSLVSPRHLIQFFQLLPAAISFACTWKVFFILDISIFSCLSKARTHYKLLNFDPGYKNLFDNSRKLIYLSMEIGSVGFFFFSLLALCVLSHWALSLWPHLQNVTPHSWMPASFLQTLLCVLTKSTSLRQQAAPALLVMKIHIKAWPAPPHIP